MMNLKEAVDEYKTYLTLELDKSENTVRSYVYDVEYMLYKYDENISYKKKISDYTQSDYEKAVASLANKSPTTQRRRVIAFRQFWRFMLRNGFVSSEIYVETPKVPQRKYGHMTKDEVVEFFSLIDTDTPSGKCDYAMFMLLLASGIRIGELCKLKISDFYYVRRFIKVKGKGDKERTVVVDEETMNILKDYFCYVRPKLNRYDSDLFFLQKNGKAVTESYCYHHIKKIADQMGKKITPHTFRHTCATFMLENGADIRYIQEQLGHASPATTQIYADVSTKKIMADYMKYFNRRKSPDDMSEEKNKEHKNDDKEE